MPKVKYKLCLSTIRNIKEHRSRYNLRQSDSPIPRYNSVTYSGHSLRYSGPKLWGEINCFLMTDEPKDFMSFGGKDLTDRQ